MSFQPYQYGESSTQWTKLPLVQRWGERHMQFLSDTAESFNRNVRELPFSYRVIVSSCYPFYLIQTKYPRRFWDLSRFQQIISPSLSHFSPSQFSYLVENVESSCLGIHIIIHIRSINWNNWIWRIVGMGIGMLWRE